MITYIGISVSPSIIILSDWVTWELTLQTGHALLKFVLCLSHISSITQLTGNILCITPLLFVDAHDIAVVTQVLFMCWGAVAKFAWLWAGGEYVTVAGYCMQPVVWLAMFVTSTLLSHE